ncbi:ABC-type metal ion transporter, periplasmic subunit [Methanobacterium paludis]|uniref:ABC-type metal ion transporter, periplasmic subunit n=1 Tax=Methanobacterium paludis (strain DSM 25820 / JCM 18151 / SWAN1) TaxID=868131 RepID=F6D598_METPW|nr:ABC-type metal ion transporter, periplasmic subunit [Methanobacterium paludis]
MVDKLKKTRLIIVILVLIFIVSILTYFANQQSNTTNNSGKIGVAVSVGPEVEFVNAVGGDKVNVTLMVPSGADPHTYEPLPNQLRELSNDKMYVEVGTPLEFETNYMERLESINPNMLIVNASEGIDLIPNTAENESGSDPHVWVSPKNAKIMVENIYQGLVQIDPANKEYYTKNRDQYLQQLDELDENITESLKGKENSTIIVYHPAWGYFCRDYNLKEIAIEAGGKEPTSQGIANLIDVAKNGNIKVIFVEPQYDPKSADVVASEIGGQVLPVDDLAENYVENMKKVAETFSKV